MIRRRHHKATPIIILAVFVGGLMFTACQNGSRSLNGTGSTTDPFPTTGDSGIGSSSGTGTGVGSVGTGPGSGPGGGITDADKQALQAALSQNDDTSPQDDTAGLSAALQDEARRLLAEEQQGKDVAVQKMLLAGKMLQECANRIAHLAPIPGQPLLGTWNGGGQCAVAFEVAGNGAGGKYAVDGGTKGTLTADTQGHGAIQGDPFSGNVVDSPQSGHGTLTHPTFFKSKAGTSPCSVGVALVTPKSPIPANYQEAMKQAGKCFRQTLILMSPAFDRMFKNMDPALAQLLQQKFLGIGGK